jgi:acylphosphatase
MEARKFSSLSGFVRNLDDGRVEALFEGEDSEVLKMVAWCGHGPSAARVERLEVVEESVGNEVDLPGGARDSGFQILRN